MFRKHKLLNTKLDSKTRQQIVKEIKNMNDKGKFPVRIVYDSNFNHFSVWYIE